MTRLLFISLLFFSFCSIKQGVAQNTGKIYWRQDSILEWSDFKGKRDDKTRVVATSFVGVEFRTEWRMKEDKNTLKYVLKAFFNPSVSWSKKELETPEILHHEQIHFNIVECLVRIASTALDKYADTNVNRNEVDAYMQQIMMAEGQLHKRYDDQTSYGNNELVQEKWTKYTTDLLKNPPTLDEALKKMPN